MEQKNILITNDDGIDSSGLRQLAEAAGRFGRVWVVAPDGERSAMSHCYTWKKSVRVWERDFPVEGVTAWATDGTPADCVRLGVLKLLPVKPDYVLAGINSGYNISHDIQYSATVGAALEASMWGVHAIAFSRGERSGQDMVDRYLSELMEEYMKSLLEQGQVWNINFPNCGLADCKGIRRNCRVSRDPFYVDHYEAEGIAPAGGAEAADASGISTAGSDEDPAGGTAYRLVIGRNWKGSEGTDLAAVIDHYISVGTVTNVG